MNNPYINSFNPSAYSGGPLVNRAMPGGPMAPTVLPPDYNPADINPYGMKLNQGMINSPYQSMFQTPYGNYNPYGSPVQELPKSYQDLTDVRFTSRGGQTGRGEEFLSNFVGNTEGDQLTLRRRLQRAMDQGLLSYANPLPTAQPQQGMFSSFMMPQMPQLPTNFGGVSYPQFNMFNPYAQGMFSGFGMQAPQQQADPYALPTQPFQNPFGGYTDYTGVNQQFIDARRNLIDALSSQAGMSPEQAVRAADNSTILNSIVNSMGGRRYGENSFSSDNGPDTSSTGAGL